MENSFWQNKKVFLTGGSGFIGSHLLHALCDLGAHVYATQHITPIDEPRCTPLFGFDISDPMSFDAVWSEVFKPDIVFHLAAYPIVTKAEDNPDEAFATNVAGTYNVLRAFPNTTIIVASTDKVYGRAPVPCSEDTPLLGTHQAYEATKTAADVLAQSFFHRGEKVAITRACNIFGYDKESTRIVPHIITSILKNETIRLRSGVDYFRDYLYVGDIVEGYLKLGEWRHWSDWGDWQPVAFNFGGHNLSVLDLINIISEAMGVTPNYEVVGNSTNEIKNQQLDWSLAYEVLKWIPSPFSMGIKETICEYTREEIF